MAIQRLPYDAAVGAEVDDGTLDAHNESASGVASPLSIRADRKRTFHLTIGPNQIAAIVAAHDTHRARWPIAVRDWGEYTYKDEVLAYTQDTSTTFAPLGMTKTFGDRFRFQRILVPDEDEVPTVVKVDGVALDREDWDFADFGIVAIPNELVGTAAVITASGRMLVAVRFVEDNLTRKVQRRPTYEADGFTVRSPGIISLPEVTLREIFEPELIALMAQPDDSA